MINHTPLQLPMARGPTVDVVHFGGVFSMPS
jgi:hypothetical protein